MDLRNKRKPVKLSSRFNFGSTPRSYSNAMAAANSPVSPLPTALVQQPASNNTLPPSTSNFFVSEDSTPTSRILFTTEGGDYFIPENQ